MTEKGDRTMYMRIREPVTLQESDEALVAGERTIEVLETTSGE